MLSYFGGTCQRFLLRIPCNARFFTRFTTLLLLEAIKSCRVIYYALLKLQGFMDFLSICHPAVTGLFVPNCLVVRGDL